MVSWILISGISYQLLVGCHKIFRIYNSIQYRYVFYLRDFASQPTLRIIIVNGELDFDLRYQISVIGGLSQNFSDLQFNSIQVGFFVCDFASQPTLRIIIVNGELEFDLRYQLSVIGGLSQNLSDLQFNSIQVGFFVCDFASQPTQRIIIVNGAW